MQSQHGNRAMELG